MRPLEIAILGSLMMILLLLSTAQSAPFSDDVEQNEQAEVDEQKEARWLLNHLANFQRNRRNGHNLDAGFQSRHSILYNLFKAQDAARLVQDPFGPGRRK
ncbi:hypothetical protein Bpfe_021245, partial [Biomphalaria pfeifferi]